MATTLINPFRDPDVLTRSCRGGTCVLNADHGEPHRTHYRPGDRVLQLAGSQPRRVDGRTVIYSALRTPCCNAASFEDVERVVWNQENGHHHKRRCGYRTDGSGKKSGADGCGWWWDVEPILPEFVDHFLAGASTAVVWVCGDY